MKITDPDSFVRSSSLANLGADGNIWIDTDTLLVYMDLYGSLTTDGASLQAVYSYLKEEWKSDAALIKFPFPMVPITPEQFEFVDDWKPANVTTSNLFRDGGYAIKRADGTSILEYPGIITLGSIGASDQVYYQQVADGASKNIVLTGAVNQVVRAYANATGLDISFAATGSTITSTATDLSVFEVGDTIEIIGSVSNNGTYTVASVTSATEIAVNEALVDEGTGANVNITVDYRSYFKIFVREYQKLYAQSQLGDIGVSTFTYQAYRFPLANSADLKITNDDATVSSALPYTDMNITYLTGAGFTTFADNTAYSANSVVKDSTGRWFITTGGGTSSTAGALDVASDTGITDWTSYLGERQIGTAYYPFNIIVDADVADDGNLPTAEQIYELVQYSLRQDSDIDAGAGVVVGKTADSLLKFVGDTLETSTGVYIDQFSDTDINRIEFYDATGVKRTFPFVAAGVINFNDNLVLDIGAVYRMYFTDANGNTFSSANAIIVQDKNGTDIAGNITGSSVQFTFDYDGNTQGGRTAGTDAPVTVVASGLDRAQYVKAASVIGRSNANSVSLVAALERVYKNPA